MSLAAALWAHCGANIILPPYREMLERMVPRVLANCPSTGQVVATHAVMSPKQFRKPGLVLSFWCSACLEAHHLEHGHLWLEEIVKQPPA
jgi:hypothetical protein